MLQKLSFYLKKAINEICWWALPKRRVFNAMLRELLNSSVGSVLPNFFYSAKSKLLLSIQYSLVHLHLAVLTKVTVIGPGLATLPIKVSHHHHNNYSGF